MPSLWLNNRKYESYNTIDYFSCCLQREKFCFTCTKAGLLALFSYTSLPLFRDLTMSQRNGDYNTWKYFDAFLFDRKTLVQNIN